MINEAFFVLTENVATAAEIDAGMQLSANQPLGPLALADLIGLDVCLSVMDVLLNNLGDSKYRACPLLREMAAGKHGRKSGRGVYVYDPCPCHVDVTSKWGVRNSIPNGLRDILDAIKLIGYVP